jgi:hypothetical protein
MVEMKQQSIVEDNQETFESSAVVDGAAPEDEASNVLEVRFLMDMINYNTHFDFSMFAPFS